MYDINDITKGLENCSEEEIDDFLEFFGTGEFLDHLDNN